MYLTRIELNAARRGTRHLLSSQQRMHAAVMASFPGDGADGSSRVLWRLDRLASKQLHLYLSSPKKPDLTHVVEQAGWPTTSSWETREYDPFLQRLATGQAWAFRLTANPVRSLASDHGRGRVVPHVTVDQQESWLRERSVGWGFEVPSAPEADDSHDMRVVDRRTVTFARREGGAERRASGGRVTLSMASFQGVLVVRDADQLRDALVKGMGRAKGYGCGLMSLARTS